MVMRPRPRPQRGHLDHAIDHAGTKEPRLHSGGVVEVERHPAEVTLPHQAFVWARRVTLQQFEVTRELASAEIGVMEILAFRRTSPRHLQMFLHGLRRIGTAPSPSVRSALR